MPEKPLHYVVERSARRTIGLYVERDGSVLVKAPASATDQRIAEVVTSKSRWIYRTQARWAEMNPPRERKEFVSGETVYFLGRPHRLDFRPETPRGVQKLGDVFAMNSSDRGRAVELLKGYYRAEGLIRLPILVHEHASSMGVKPGRLRVQELGHRWGSCSPAGNLNFHWKAMAVPIEVLRYLVVHELAHLVHRDHSELFWRVVETEMTGWKRHAKWLADHGAEMTL